MVNASRLMHHRPSPERLYVITYSKSVNCLEASGSKTPDPSWKPSSSHLARAPGGTRGDPREGAGRGGEKLKSEAKTQEGGLRTEQGKRLCSPLYRVSSLAATSTNYRPLHGKVPGFFVDQTLNPQRHSDLQQR
ncbi:hypothetical protein BaRGS_00006103 [Batillaria attramentaria]|uniref:Uncharacterized protein n=1 Tax=Batillaria attramentaria TaxID=370345 RepID=A0ABD0LTM1_9CAEN